MIRRTLWLVSTFKHVPLQPINMRRYFGGVMNKPERRPSLQIDGLFEKRKIKQDDSKQSANPSTTFSNMLYGVLQSSRLLNKLDSKLLNDVCRAFFSYDAEHLEKQKQTYQRVRACLSNTTRGSQADEIYSAIRSIAEFFDQSEAGLLKGDLHSKAIFELEKYLTKLLDDEHQATELLAIEDKIYQEVLELVTTAHNFRLPKEGIHSYMIDNARNIYERQLLLEKESNDLAVEKMIKIHNQLQKFEKAQNLEFSKRHMVEWFPILTKAIKEEQDACRNDNIKGDRSIYAEQFLKIAPEKIAALALSELMKAIIGQVNRTENKDEMYGAIRAGTLFEKIGDAVNCQIIYQKQQREFKNQQKELQKKRNEAIKRRVEEKKMDREHVIAERQYEQSQNTRSYKKYMKPQLRKAYLEKLASRIMRSSRSSDSLNGGFSKHSKIIVGSLLTYLMKSIIKVNNKYGFPVPLLTSDVKKINQKAEFGSNVLLINEDFILSLISNIQKEDNSYLHMDRSLPTIIEPAPWVDYEIGGYYLRPTTIMRYSLSGDQERAVKYADLSRVSGVLDILSKVPWKINPKILKIVEQIWLDGGGQGTIPHKFYDMKNYVYQFQLKQERDPKRREQLERIIQQQRNVHSLRCDFMLKLNVAQSYLNIDKFYFPHNLDFRGRVYPIPPHLNHIGADLPRGLLMFSEGMKLGSSGLKWLKIHTANLMGFDKARLPDKLQFVEKNMALIMAIAQNPLQQKQWLEYEDCWQALSSIIELAEALKSGNPSEYVSHLHIHQDGSCNGLQHYAALGRDTEGAAQVNLDILDKPGDIYSHVASMVNQLIERDSKDASCPNHELAKKLKGHVKRKTIKQTVMTSVYGVTFIGARDQIYRQVRDQKFMESEQEQYQASIELAKYTMECIKNLFDRAHNIKKWLIDCAGIISDTNNPVSWITPIGVPVIQPYRVESETDQVRTAMHTIVVNKHNSKLPINKLRQKSAFPPNFVHSLDSTHMMYTAEQCYLEGITFAAVHDSYWTHAASVERMNVILREQFIRLHKEPLLENLRESFQRRYPDKNFPPIPARGLFDLDRIKQSLYFFS